MCPSDWGCARPRSWVPRLNFVERRPLPFLGTPCSSACLLPPALLAPLCIFQNDGGTGSYAAKAKLLICALEVPPF